VSARGRLLQRRASRPTLAAQLNAHARTVGEPATWIPYPDMPYDVAMHGSGAMTTRGEMQGGPSKQKADPGNRLKWKMGRCREEGVQFDTDCRRKDEAKLALKLAKDAEAEAMRGILGQKGYSVRHG